MHNFFKLLLSVAAFVVATDKGNSQTFINTPNDTVYSLGMFDNLETLLINQLNVSSDTITLKWKKISEIIPNFWEASICDNSFCNTTLLDSGIMNPVAPGDFGFLLLHITPHLNSGIAIIRYEIWDTLYPQQRDTLTYMHEVNNTSGQNEEKYEALFNVFPNPTSENIIITVTANEGFEYIITDVFGKKVLDGYSQTNSFSASVSSLPNGIYTVSINKKANCKTFIIQQ